MRPRVVGIAGGSASGKSTVAAALVRALGDDCLHIVHDRYYRPMPESIENPPSSYNFDHPKALETPRLVADLQTLLSGRSARLPRYDFALHRRVREAGWDEVTPRPVILVEGILVLADVALTTLMDVRVFVHAPAEVRLARRIRRDVAERGRSAASVLSQYETTVRPMHDKYVEPSRAHAHHVLDGEQRPAILVAELLDLLS